jgi:hypothetical protein
MNAQFTKEGHIECLFCFVVFCFVLGLCDGIAWVAVELTRVLVSKPSLQKQSVFSSEDKASLATNTVEYIV